MSRSYVLGLLGLAAMIVMVGPVPALEMTLADQPDAEGNGEAYDEQPARSGPLLVRGRVVAVDPASGSITLEFRPIPHLLLEGGTRSFSVANPLTLTGLGPGDKVRFEVRRNGRSYTVTRIENSN
jgi:Cu/Ag efflux protein CusF